MFWRVFTAVVFTILLGYSVSANAVEPIKVLLARGATNIPEAVAREALDQANDVMIASGLASHVFESATFDGSLPTVFSANCPGSVITPGTTHLACAQSQLASARNQHKADVVLMIVDDMNLCGQVPPDMINASISLENEDLAYVVIKDDCLVNPVQNMKVAAHELGHLLSLEHHDGDSDSSEPVSDNHAAEDSLVGFGNITVEGDPGSDCFFCEVHGFFSESGRMFPNGEPAGDDTFSNSKRVVEEESWGVVALYRESIFANGIRFPWAAKTGTLIDPRREGARYLYQGSGVLGDPARLRETLQEAIADMNPMPQVTSLQIIAWDEVGKTLVRPYAGNFPPASFSNRNPAQGDPDDTVSGQIGVLELVLTSAAYDIAGGNVSFTTFNVGPTCDELESAAIDDYFVTTVGRVIRRVPAGTPLNPGESNVGNCGGTPQFRIYSTGRWQVWVFRAIQAPPEGLLVRGEPDEFRVLQPAFSCTMENRTDPLLDVTNISWTAGNGAPNPRAPVRRIGHPDYGAQVNFWIPQRDAAVAVGEMLSGGECLDVSPNTWQKSYGVTQSWAYAIPE